MVRPAGLAILVCSRKVAGRVVHQVGKAATPLIIARSQRFIPVQTDINAQESEPANSVEPPLHSIEVKHAGSGKRGNPAKEAVRNGGDHGAEKASGKLIPCQTTERINPTATRQNGCNGG